MASVRQALFSAILLFSLPLLAASVPATVATAPVSTLKSNHWSLPLAFERNEGQLVQEIGFLGRTQHYTVTIGRKELRFALPGKTGTSSVALSFEGSNAATPRGIVEAPFRTNSYIGSDITKYRTGIRNYSRIGLSHIYTGVDAEFYASGDEIEHDFNVAPGADADAISMRLNSERAARLTTEGEVVVPSAEGELLLKKPVAYQEGPDGKHIAIEAAFVLSSFSRGEQGLRFRLGAYDHSRKLVIDPVILYASYLGGTAGSTANAITAESTNGIFVTGTTASASFDPTPASNTTSPVTPTANCGTASCSNNIFIANFTPDSAGPTLHWITYLGATDSSLTIAATSMVANSSTLYLGGYTNDSALSTGSSGIATYSMGGYVGFISALTPSSGALNNTALVYSDGVNANNNSVQALALDASGSLYATGMIGTQLAASDSRLVLIPTSDAFTDAIPQVTTYNPASLPQPGNAYVLKMAGSVPANSEHLVTPSFFTYIQANSLIRGIAVDGIGSIYLGGQTQGGFSLQSATGTNSGTAATNDAFEVTFQGIGSAVAVTGFTWLDGDGDDTVAALALDGVGGSYLFGNTTSTGLGTSGVLQGSPSDLSGNGFVAQIAKAAATIPAGGTPPTALTYLGGSGAHDSITGGIYSISTGTLYITGQTDAPATTDATTHSVAFAGIPSTSNTTSGFNTQAMVQGMDSTVGGTVRGYLASLSSNLTSVNYVVNIGGSGGTDLASGVALDNSTQNAYVAATIGVNSSSAATPPYTSYTAYQGNSPTTTLASTSAYVAEIASSNATSALVLKKANGSPSAPQIGYSSSIASPITYTWTLDSRSPSANTVVQIPAVAGLLYNSVTVTDPGNSGATPFPACTITDAGASCLIPGIPQFTPNTNDTLTITLDATTNSALTGSSVTVAANVFSPASDYASVSQTTPVSAPAKLTITPTTFPNVTVSSGSSADAASHTQVSYAVVVQNAAGAGDTSTATLTIDSLPEKFIASHVTAVAGGGGTVTTCDLSSAATGCSSFDLPAGASLIYTVTGYYPDSAVPLNSASILETSPLSATASGFLSKASASIATNTTVQRSAHLKIVGSLSSGSTPINLDDSDTYTITITNSGPSASSGNDTFNLTLPSGFTADSNPQLVCASGTSNCKIPSLAVLGTHTLAISGKFPDTSSNAGIGKAAATKTFSTTVQLADAVDSAPAPSDETSNSTVNVQRTATLSLIGNTLTAPASVCSGGAKCVYMKNAENTQDNLAYNFIVKNAGPNSAVNATFTITLPSAPSNSFGMHVLSVGTPAVTALSPPFGSAPVCTYNGTTQIVCSAGNLPKGDTALTISGTGTFDNNSVPLTAASVNTVAGSVHMEEDANGAPVSDSPTPTVEVDRAAHLVTTKQVVPSGMTPTLPISLDESASKSTPGINDTFTVTAQVGNTPLNNAPGVVVTDTLPRYFRVLQPPSAGANCTVGTPALAVTANYTTGATPVTMTCAVGTVNAGNAVASSGTTPASVGTAFQSFTYSGKFLDNGVNPDITGTPSAKMKQLSVPLGATSSATILAVDPNSSDATSAAQSISVERLVHLILRKTRNTSVAAVPASFADMTDPNLDEKTTLASFGVNDEIEYDIALGNAGVNTALGVQFTETLPPYFTLIKAYLISGSSTTPDTGANAVPGAQLPVGSIACYAGSAVGTTPITLPYATAGASQQITCSYGTTANPLSLPPGASKAGMPDPATSIEFVYQGKYQDNAPGVDNIGLGVSTSAITSVAGEAVTTSPLVVDNGPATDSRSLAVPTYSIQRAAHLTITGTPAQLKPDETPLTPGGPGNTAIIAEAEPSSTGATPVYNCLRYKVLVQNIGPNIARQPQLTVAPPAGLNLAESSSGITTTPGSDAPLPSSCTYGTTTSSTVSGAAIVPVSQKAGNTLVIDIDGYFGLNTLAAGNSQTGFPFSYTALADKGIMDSAKTMAFTPLTGSNVTVVNTPSGGNFFVSPFTSAGTRPARVAFGSVVTPGITTTIVSGTGPALPVGNSPDPRDNKKVTPLYRTGSSAVSFYTLGTTATPAAGTNPTGICLTSGSASGALADGFAKPERVLLWALSGLPAGTALNAIPNVTAPYPGDITSSVTPSSGSSYVVPGGPALPYTTYDNLPAPQSQPAQVCGQVNGFAPAAAPVTVAVLEPVNFAPFISPNTQQISQTPGKGVSEVSFLFPTVTHDANDSDPCYVASSTSGTPSRGVCDDNLLLTTWVFGGESLVPSQNHIIGPLSPAEAQTFENAPAPYEVQAGATLFFQVADQLAASQYKGKRNCDPGNAPGSYVPNTVNACPITTSLLAGTPPQETVFGSADIALLTPSVGGGSSGLITLPPAANAAIATTSVASGYTGASATITAGQTVGFQWKLGDVIPAAGGTYNLNCFMVDAATQTTVTPFPAGLTCQIPQTITYPANPTSANSPSSPSIYIVTTGTQTAGNPNHFWNTATGIFTAMLLPFLLFRRREQVKKSGLFVILLLLGGAVSLSGCGSGFSAASVQSVAANTYYFRANATPVNGGTLLTTAPFQVKVVAGN